MRDVFSSDGVTDVVASVAADRAKTVEIGVGSASALATAFVVVLGDRRSAKAVYPVGAAYVQGDAAAT